MEIFHRKTQYDFIGKRYIPFLFSGTLVAASIVSLAVKGLNYSIDFVGGNAIRMTFAQPTEIGALRAMLEKAGYPQAVPQQFTGTNSFQVRIKAEGDGDAKAVDTFLEKFKAADPAKIFTLDSREFVGPTVGRHLFKQAVLAVLFSLAGIVVYVAFRFSSPVWGISGVIALAHDVVITAGLISLLHLEFDLTLVAALLTLAGYSINDTVVIFDRMRERMGTHRREALGQNINASINETLSRTIITSLTVFLTLVVLLAFGGAVIHDFALCMTFGVVFGTYSSIAVAAPIIFEWESRRAGAVVVAPEPEPLASGKPRGKPRRA